MVKGVCPFWVGYLLINPLRYLLENPKKILGKFVREGMVVLEPGCGMGFFTIPLARMVGPSGKVIALDIEPRMITVLEKRAAKASMLNRIERRLCPANSLGLQDLRESVDLVVAIHMVHETADTRTFLQEIRSSLKAGGRLLIVEPRGHVSKQDFQKSILLAHEKGFTPSENLFDLQARKVLLHKSTPEP